MTKKNDKLHIYALQILFACGISFGSQAIQLENWYKWLAIVARYVVYLLIIKGSHELNVFAYSQFIARSKINFNKIYQQCKTYLLIFAASIAVLVYTKQRIINEDFLFLFIGYIITKYPEINLKTAEKNYKKTPKELYKNTYIETRLENLEQLWTVFKEGHKSIFDKSTLKDKQDAYFTGNMYEEFEELYVSFKALLKEDLQSLCEASSVPPNSFAGDVEKNSSTINYGVGMACSFFEGYLAHIIPSDGARFVGFEENINLFESQQRVIFPVKRLFIVITKSLYCPPDLKQFNKKNKDLPYLEACQSLEDVEKDVAGVKNRTYRNSAYKIHRPRAPPLYLAAECATPLHTLHRVLERKALYEELSNVDPQEIVTDFCGMLQSIIRKSPDCCDKCELVFYNDKDPNENLADLLIEKIRELEPDFENIIAQKR